METKKTRNPIVDKTYQFALKIIAFSEVLDGKGKTRFADQILRSGTSIGANVREAQMAESKKDFLHKVTVAAKEGEETEFWLMLCRDAETYPDPGNLLDQCVEINKILNKIVETTKSRINNKRSVR